MVAADQLQEMGHEKWPEFIRDQIKMEQLLTPITEHTDEEEIEIERLNNRVRELLSPRLQHTTVGGGRMGLGLGLGLGRGGGTTTAQWVLNQSLPFLPALRRVLDVPEDGNFLGVVTRGFVDEIECATPRWIREADELLQWLPLQVVRLWTAPQMNRSEDGLSIVGDPKQKHFSEEDIPQKPGDELDLRICQARWPEVRFEILSRVVAVTGSSIGIGHSVGVQRMLIEEEDRPPVVQRPNVPIFGRQLSTPGEEGL
jgi:hypothetical protein